MRNPIQLIGAALLLLVSSASMAAENAHPVPSYIDYMRICIGAYEKATFTIDVKDAFALCQCNSERLPKDGDMTQSELIAAVKSCGEEHAADPKGFAESKSEKALKLIEQAAARENSQGL